MNNSQVIVHLPIENTPVSVFIWPKFKPMPVSGSLGATLSNSGVGAG